MSVLDFFSVVIGGVGILLVFIGKFNRWNAKICYLITGIANSLVEIPVRAVNSLRYDGKNGNNRNRKKRGFCRIEA